MPGVGIRYIIEDDPAAIRFYTTLLGFKLDLDASRRSHRCRAMVCACSCVDWG